MVLYFSGTGNSRYAADMIASITNDTLVSMNAVLKEEKNKSFHSNQPFVFVGPVYSWRIPKVMEDFIKRNRFNGNHKAYFVLTCGSSDGNAIHYIEKLCEEKGFEFLGLSTIVMPENYIAMFPTPNQTEAEQIIKNAEPIIAETAQKIKNGEPLYHKKVSLPTKALSAILPSFFYPFCVHAKGFYSTDACTTCGKCASLCPLNNISIDHDKPKWENSCTHCMACIGGCPSGAIEYKKKTQKRNKYYNNK